MTSLDTALESAEKLANLLQESRGTSAQRWHWERETASLHLHPHGAALHDGYSLHDDLLACGEVLHLARTALVDKGWEVRTTILGGADGPTAIASLEVVGTAVEQVVDELYDATRARMTDADTGVAAVDPQTALILLQDAAVEHDAELATFTRTELEAAGVRISGHGGSTTTWRTVSHDQVVAAVLHTADDTPAVQVRAGVASAEVQMTAANLGLDAVPLVGLESINILKAADIGAGHPRIAFQLVDTEDHQQARPSVWVPARHGARAQLRPRAAVEDSPDW